MSPELTLTAGLVALSLATFGGSSKAAAQSNEKTDADPLISITERAGLMLRLRLSKSDAAKISIASKILKNSPDDSHALLERGRANAHRGRYQDALKDLEHLSELLIVQQERSWPGFEEPNTALNFLNHFEIHQAETALAFVRKQMKR